MIAPLYVRFKSALTVSLSNTFVLDVWHIFHNISVFSDIVEILPWVTFIFCDGNLVFCPFCFGTYRWMYVQLKILSKSIVSLSS